MAVYIKVHNSYRSVVAVADSDLLGKRFEEGIKQLDVRENFYNGKKIEREEEVIKKLKIHLAEDATFNFAGKEAVNLAVKAEVISEKSVGYIDNIPYALKLL